MEGDRRPDGSAPLLPVDVHPLGVPGGRSERVLCPSHWLVRDLRMHLQRSLCAADLDPDARLVHNGRALEDDAPLAAVLGAEQGGQQPAPVPVLFLVSTRNDAAVLTPSLPPSPHAPQLYLRFIADACAAGRAKVVRTQHGYFVQPLDEDCARALRVFALPDPGPAEAPAPPEEQNAGLFAADDAALDENEPRARESPIRIALKLLLLVMLFGRGAGIVRLAIMAALALLLFLTQTGWLPIEALLRRPAARRNAAEVPAAEAAPERRAVDEPLSYVQEAYRFLTAFLASLVPDGYANAANGRHAPGRR